MEERIVNYNKLMDIAISNKIDFIEGYHTKNTSWYSIEVGNIFYKTKKLSVEKWKDKKKEK